MNSQIDLKPLAGIIHASQRWADALDAIESAMGDKLNDRDAASVELKGSARTKHGWMTDGENLYHDALVKILAAHGYRIADESYPRYMITSYKEDEDPGDPPDDVHLEGEVARLGLQVLELQDENSRLRSETRATKELYEAEVASSAARGKLCETLSTDLAVASERAVSLEQLNVALQARCNFFFQDASVLRQALKVEEIDRSLERERAKLAERMEARKQAFLELHKLDAVEVLVNLAGTEGAPAPESAEAPEKVAEDSVSTDREGSEIAGFQNPCSEELLEATGASPG